MIIRQNDNYNYNYKEFIFDTVEDLNAQDIKSVSAGSTAFVIEGSRAFILSASGEWKEI